MSVFPFALPMVHDQLVGLSVHLSPPPKIRSLPLYSSMKWKVVEEFNGTPDWVKTPPPVSELVIQSPTFAVGVLANKSPSMPKPPAGETTGATPAGGGDASPGWLRETRKESKTREIRVLTRHFGGELIEFMGILSKVSFKGECRLDCTGGVNFSGPTLICEGLKASLMSERPMLPIRHNKSATIPPERNLHDLRADSDGAVRASGI